MTRAECAQATDRARPFPLSRTHAAALARTNTHAYTPANQRANRFQRQSDRHTDSESRPWLKSWEIKSDPLAVEREPDRTGTLVP